MRIRVLAQDIARHLMQPLGRALVGRFSDGEIQVEIMENVRGKDVYLVQSTCPPANEHLMELLVMADACRRASAGRITAVIPYLGYARQDRRQRAMRVPITAKLVADMIGCAGVNRVLTVDLHADQIQGFFGVPVDNVYASPVLLGEVWKQKYDKMIVVSPDVGGVVRARALARRLDNADLAIIDKRRQRANESQVMNIIGDVRGTVLRAGGRPRRHRGHALPGGERIEGRRRGARDRLHHAPGAVGQGGGADLHLGARRARRDGHDSARRGRESASASASCRSQSCSRRRCGGSGTRNPSVRCTWIRHWSH